MAGRAPPRIPGYRDRGTCEWCAQPILYPAAHKCAGETNTKRGWHPECVTFYKVAAWQASAANAVWHRCDGKCQLCGLACERESLVGYKKESYAPGRTSWSRQFDGLYSKADDWVLYSHAKPVFRALWHADHIVPLWSAPRTIEQRGCFFSVLNLWLLCERCHKAKTAREAAARALAKSRQFNLFGARLAEAAD